MEPTTLQPPADRVRSTSSLSFGGEEGQMRFAHYFALVGPGPELTVQDPRAEDDWKGYFVDVFSRSFSGRVERRLPMTDHDDCPFPESVWMFCLPQGIRLAPSPSPPTWHSFVLTNLDSSRLYGCALTYYQLLDVENESRVREALEGDLYLPRAICLVSSLPCFEALRDCLIEVHRMGSVAPGRVDELVTKILSQSVVSCGGLKTEPFRLTLGDRLIPVPAMDERPMHTAFRTLFSSLNLHHLLTLVECMLTERRMVLTSQRLSRLVYVAEVAMQLIEPFVWQQTYIPLLPNDLLECMHAPGAFLMGVPWELVRARPFREEILKQGIVLVDLDRNRIDSWDDVSPYPFRTSLLSRLSANVHPFVDDDSFWIENDLVGAIRKAFRSSYAALLQDYQEFLVVLQNGDNKVYVFNKVAFLRAKPEDERDFFVQFFETQLFACFLDEQARGDLQNPDALFGAPPDLSEADPDASDMHPFVREQFPRADGLAETDVPCPTQTTAWAVRRRRTSLAPPESPARRSAGKTGSSDKIPTITEEDLQDVAAEAASAEPLSPEESDALEFLVEVISKLYSGDSFHMGELIQARQVMSTPVGRTSFIALLQQTSKYEHARELEEESFDGLCNLANVCLDEASLAGHVDICPAILELGQQFYRFVDQGNEEMLITRVTRHAVWNDISLWAGILNAYREEAGSKEEEEHNCSSCLWTMHRFNLPMSTIRQVVSRVTHKDQLRHIREHLSRTVLTMETLTESMEQGATADVDPRSKRNQEFRQRFDLPKREFILEEHPANLVGKKLSTAGTMYLSTNYICFMANFIALKIKEVIPLSKPTAIDFLQGASDISVIRLRVGNRRVVVFESPHFCQDTALAIKRNWVLCKTRDAMHRPSDDEEKPALPALRGKIRDGVRMEDILTAHDLHTLLDGAKQLTFNSLGVISSPDGPGSRALYYVARGRVRVVQGLESTVVGYMVPGVTFGEVAFLVGGSTVSFIADEEDVMVYMMDPAYVDALVEEEPSLGGRFYQYLAAVVVHKLRTSSVAAQPLGPAAQTPSPMDSPRSVSGSPLLLRRGRSFQGTATEQEANKIRRMFNLADSEPIHNVFKCVMVKAMPLSGTLLVTSRSFCFYAKILGMTVREIYLLRQVSSLSKMVDAIELSYKDTKSVTFGGFEALDDTYDTMLGMWRAAKAADADASPGNRYLFEADSPVMLRRHQTSEDGSPRGQSMRHSLTIEENGGNRSPQGPMRASVDLPRPRRSFTGSFRSPPQRQGSQNNMAVRSLDANDILLLLKGAQRRTFSKDEAIVEEGGMDRMVYQIAKGEVRVVKKQDDGALVLRTLKEGQMFGEMTFLEGGERHASVVADIDGVEVYVLSAEFVESLLGSESGLPARFYRFLGTSLAARLREGYLNVDVNEHRARTTE